MLSFAASAASELPESLARHPLVQRAWEGLDFQQVWDVHVHLVGVGDDPESGIWLHPRHFSPLHPVAYLSRAAFMRGAKVDPKDVDRSFVRRLLALTEDFPPGYRVMLLAFDGCYDARGALDLDKTPFLIPNRYAAALARRHPERLAWIASIHPHRGDAVEALEAAAEEGAMAVKWLPQAMGIDPAEPRCDPFYDALARLQLPLLCHTGVERAVHGGVGEQEWANPLRLRRALDRGVTVIAAHCASLGRAVDIDQGPDGPSVPAWRLFFRLLDEPQYHHQLFGDLSATLLANRESRFQHELLRRREWASRLLQGSDYPLPGVKILLSPTQLAEEGLLDRDHIKVLKALRRHNPLLYEFVLKRTITLAGESLPANMFHTRRAFPRAM
ncbi:MAG: amidohydrolase family protein [Magnetococcales bacterium]|nr:amidohydrolase family protein [Magnetococcales bacterium]